VLGELLLNVLTSQLLGMIYSPDTNRLTKKPKRKNRNELSIGTLKNQNTEKLLWGTESWLNWKNACLERKAMKEGMKEGKREGRNKGRKER
jgi:hypothetical protein